MYCFCCSHFVEQSFPFSISSLLLRVIQPLPFVTVKRRIMGIIGVMDPINFEYLENFLWPTEKGSEDKKENKTLLIDFSGRFISKYKRTDWHKVLKLIKSVGMKQSYLTLISIVNRYPFTELTFQHFNTSVFSVQFKIDLILRVKFPQSKIRSRYTFSLVWFPLSAWQSWHSHFIWCWGTQHQHVTETRVSITYVWKIIQFMILLKPL